MTRFLASFHTAHFNSAVDTRIHLDAEPIKNGRIEVGYRQIDTDVETRNVTYNDALYFGFRYDF